MWLVLVLNAIITLGALGSLEEREANLFGKPLYAACDTTYIKKFPKTKEEVKVYCRNLRSFQNCALSFIENCNVDKDMLPTLSLFETEILLNICQEDSEYYKILGDNAKCLADSLREALHQGISPDEEINSCTTLYTMALETLNFTVTNELRELLEFYKRMEPEKREHIRCMDIVVGVRCLKEAMKRNDCYPYPFKLVIWFVMKGRLYKSMCHERDETLILNLMVDSHITPYFRDSGSKRVVAF